MTWKKREPRRMTIVAERPHYRVRPVVKPLPSRAPEAADDPVRIPEKRDPFVRPEAEDDDGYDPFSDRPPAPEPAFEDDPWN